MKRKEFSLRELAQHLAPRTLRYWYRADDYLSEWHTSAQEDLEELKASLKRPRDRLSLSDLREWTLGMPLRLPERDNTISDRLDEIDRRADMERRRAALHNRLMEKIRAVLTSSDCVIRGIGPAGTQVVVPRTIVPQLEIDLKRQVVSTKGGTWSKWEAVVVEWCPDERRKRSDRKATQKLARNLIFELYGGMPDDTVSVPAMQKRLREDKRRTFGLDVIRRALDRKK